VRPSAFRQTLSVSLPAARRGVVSSRTPAADDPTADKASSTAASWRRLILRGPQLLTRAVLGLALALLAVAAALFVLRAAHNDRVFPAIHVADLAIGGMSREAAAGAVQNRASTVEATSVVFTFGDREWRAPLGELGVRVDDAAALATAYRLGREPTASERLRTVGGLIQADQWIALPVRVDPVGFERWFNIIDRELGEPPRDAALAIAGASVTVVPEVDGTIVDRALATERIIAGLDRLEAHTGPLPTIIQPAAVRAGDLEPLRADTAAALAQPVQVTYGAGRWTLPGSELGRFVAPRVDPAKSGPAAVSVGLDRPALATSLNERLAPEINQEARDAIVGWGGEGLVSLEWSVDGVALQADQLAVLVEQSLFGDHVPVQAPVTITPPTIDSNNLGDLGVVTLLGTGTSNYSGSADGRATNVQVGADRMNGTLVPPGGEYSFNHSVGVINEENGFVEAQVIDGEQIGQDIGGGICQVSTTVFRAAYLAGLPIGEWWPHRFRIGFYEYDGWAPGLDASILQPTEDPSTWADFTFANPSDSWLLVESWADGVNVVVNIYGADLGYSVESDGPTYGEKFQMLADKEVVDPELEPGTIKVSQVAKEGEEVSHSRRVYARDGSLLREASFYTKYYSSGNVWEVSPDMEGDSPADPDRPLPPVSEPLPLPDMEETETGSGSQ